jgi:hypothetical protein
VGLPQGVGGIAILFYFVLYYFIPLYLYNKHAPGARRPPLRGWWLYFIYFVFISFYFMLVYCYNTQHVLVGLPPPRSWLHCYIILFYFIRVLYKYYTGKFISVYFYNMHQVLARLLQGVLVTAGRKRRPEGALRDHIWCAIALEDCLCDTPYARPHGRRSVPHRLWD